MQAFFVHTSAMNKRVFVGGGGLALILGGQAALSLIGPFA
jgi:hypothetical protein